MITSGALLVDKPSGVTSAAVVGKIRRRFKLGKVGHSGTLDPLATGLMVVLFGSATRLQSLFLEGDKSYEGVIRLGLCTETDDVEGRAVRQATEEELREARTVERLPELVKRFSGSISQIPPAYSAIKIDGKRSYEFARKEEPVTLQPRTVAVHRLELQLLSADQMRYVVSCSKGTYVRSLARDIGADLGVGACLESIRRTRSGPFSVEQAVRLAELLAQDEPSAALPLSVLVSDLPRLDLPADRVPLFRHGNPQAFDGICWERSDLTAVFAGPAEVLGLVRMSAGRFSIEAVFNTDS